MKRIGIFYRFLFYPNAKSLWDLLLLHNSFKLVYAEIPKPFADFRIGKRSDTEIEMQEIHFRHMKKEIWRAGTEMPSSDDSMNLFEECYCFASIVQTNVVRM